MSSQPGGGPAIPAAAAVSGLENDEDVSAETYDQGEPVGRADAEADERRAARSSDSDSQQDFVTADVDSHTDDGVPVGRADAEQDRLRASSEDADD